MNEQATNPNSANPQMIDPQSLELRDIHLPEAISWWPIAPGWWLLAGGILVLLVLIFVIRKIYISRQLKRDISTEIEIITLQFRQTQNKSELAKSLSVLIRRASLSFYPREHIAGLTGDNWLALLDDTCQLKSTSFQSETGRLLITAPYQSETSLADYDADALISLCESWLLSSHKKHTAHNSGADA